MPPKRGKWPSPFAKAPRGRPTAPRGKLRDFVPAAPTMGAHANGFSMQDEARNTASHHTWGSEDARLRQKPVSFVSAGVIEPLKEDEPSSDPSESKVAEEPVEDAMEATGNASEVEDAEKLSTEMADSITVETTIRTVEHEMTIETVEHQTTTETVEHQTTIKTVEQEKPTSELPVPEQSVSGSDQPSKAQGNETKELFFFDLGEDEPMIDPSIPPPKIPSPRSSFGASDSSEEVILFRGRTVNPRGPAQRKMPSQPSVTVAPSVELVERKAEVGVGASSKSNAQSPVPQSQPHRKRPKSQRRRSKAPEVVQNDDEDAILADYIANMAENSDEDFISSLIQSHRDLGGDDDAVNFGSGNEKSPMDGYALDVEGEGSTDSGISDAEDEDMDGDMDADMDDETFARLLAKQEELGMGGDDLAIFSSSFAQTGSRKKAGAGRALRGPASASQVADAFDNLDLADWSHLTGQSRKRRSKQPPNFNVDDSELESTMNTAWARDRERKKSRKLEREALRAEGLLDKNADPDDLRVKYRTGMKLDDVKTELTAFLLGSGERLEFPPLDKHARKVLHELASKFNINSKSTGKADTRRPVLYRTNRTIRYSSTRLEDAAVHVDQAALRINRKYFHRVDFKGQRTESPRGPPGGRGGHKAVTLRDGEIVGASVPELGQENKGRNMLEKMGWSKGMSLGALDNNGILEPVAQVMKRSKAGLG